MALVVLLGLSTANRIMTKVLFVCSGNYFRSPIMQAVSSLFWNCESDSAGIYPTFVGKPMSSVVSSIIEDLGVKNYNHSPKVVSEDVLSWADVIFVPENKHLNYLVGYNAHLLSEVAGLKMDISDPGIENHTYQAMFPIAEEIYRYIKFGYYSNLL
jgi:protein-tyrosine-phosphatase